MTTRGFPSPSRSLYVDTDLGSDLAIVGGQRGNPLRPYKSLAAAVAAAQDGDEVLCAPGLNVTATATVPVSVIKLTIRGSGLQTTVLGSGSLDLIVTHPGMTRLSIEDCTLNTKNNGRCVVASGTGGGGSFMTTGLLLRNVEFISGGLPIVVQYANIVRMQDCFIGIGNVNLAASCASVFFDGCTIAGDLSIGWSNSDAEKPTATPQRPVTVADTRIEGISEMSGQAQIDLRAGSVVGLLRGNTLSEDTGAVPAVRSQARHTGDVDFTAAGAFPDTAMALSINFDNAVFDPAVKASFEVGGAAANQQTVSMRGAVGTGTLTADDGIRIIEDSWLQSQLTTVGTGVIRPKSLSLSLTATPLGASNSVPFGFTADTPPTATVASGLGLGLGLVAPSAVSQTDVTIDVTVPGVGAGTIYVEASWA